MITWHPNKLLVGQTCSKELAVVLTKDYERILIGQRNDILKKFEDKEDACVDYDEIRPFGTLLLHGHYDKDRLWNEALSYLKNAQEIMLSPATLQLVKPSPLKDEKLAFKILKDKYETRDPLCKFVAMRIWHKYWQMRGKRSRTASQEFFVEAENLVRPFSKHYRVEANPIRVNSNNPIFRKTQDLYTCDRIKVIHYMPQNHIECLFLQSSLIPLEYFYEEKIEKWTKYIVCCKECHQHFLSDSLQFQLCSEDCKKNAQKKVREQRKKHTSTAEVDKLVAVAYSHWYNQLKRIKASPGWSEEQIRQFKIAMERFQTEKRSKRKAYKNGDITFNELRDWLCHQHAEAENALQELMVTKR